MTSVANVTIQSSQVTADLTDFPLLVDLSDMPAGFWSTVADGGGDIRVFKADGTTELAREVVSCDTATETGELWIKYEGTLSSSLDTTIQIHADGASGDYAVTATYGRNNVWSDYEFVSHDGGSTESTGNFTTTADGGVVPGAVGQIGTSTDFDGVGDGYTLPDGSLEATGDFTLQAWVNLDILADSNKGIISRRNDTGGWNYSWRDRKGESSLLIGNGAIAANTPFVTGAWLNIGVTHASGGAVTHYRAGASDGGGTRSGAVATPPVPLAIASDTPASIDTFRINGRMDEIRARFAVLSPSQFSTEHNNQSSPGTFYTASVPVATGPVTPINLTTTNILPTSARLNWEQG